MPVDAKLKTVLDAEKAFAVTCIPTLKGQVKPNPRMFSPLNPFFLMSTLAYGGDATTKTSYSTGVGAAAITDGTKDGYNKFFNQLKASGFDVKTTITGPSAMSMKTDFSTWANEKLKLDFKNTSSDSKVYFVNAIEFKSIWKTAFDAHSTVSLDFNVESRKVKIPMMCSEGSFRTAKITDYDVSFVEILLKEKIGEEDLSMIVIRMDEDYSNDTENFLHDVLLIDLDKFFATTDIAKTLKLYLPKLSYHVENRLFLNEFLDPTSRTAVVKNGGKFTDMFTVGNGPIVTYAKIKIDINETGTTTPETSAASSHAKRRRRDPTAEFLVNRPYVTMIIAKKSATYNLLLAFCVDGTNFERPEASSGSKNRNSGSCVVM